MNKIGLTGKAGIAVFLVVLLQCVIFAILLALHN